MPHFLGGRFAHAVDTKCPAANSCLTFISAQFFRGQAQVSFGKATIYKVDGKWVVRHNCLHPSFCSAADACGVLLQERGLERTGGDMDGGTEGAPIDEKHRRCTSYQMKFARNASCTHGHIIMPKTTHKPASGYLSWQGLAGSM